ncbi:MAG: metallophosphoesterase, partial [Myxococcaceae bacterium]|nr:metallophosphoesterase [Myxococcaceae bacterium]
PKGWRVQIRRVRYPVRKATQALTARKVPGGPILIHKLVEARYRHHHALLEAARRHSGLPPPGPVLRPPPGAPLRPAPAEPSLEVEPPVPRDELEAVALRAEAVDPTDLGHAQAKVLAEQPALAQQLDSVNDLDG